mgnify:CR=1 FL=1
MKKLILLLTLLFTFITTNAQSFNELKDLNNSVNGIWIKIDEKNLIIRYDNTFERRTKTKVLAAGYITSKDNQLHIIRVDKPDEYNLIYFINYETFAVTKPRNSDTAWLFTKVQDL